MKKLVVAIASFILLFNSAQSSLWAKETTSLSQSNANTIFSPATQPDRERGIWLFPFLSIFLPGLDQWWEGQYGYGAIYSGATLGGWGLIKISNKIPERHGISDSVGSLGANLWLNASHVSAWHSFRTAAKTRGEQFSYLPEDETPLDLVLAPVQFQYVLQPEIAVVMFAMASYVFIYRPLADNQKFGFPAFDKAFASLFTSHRAGVSEEALFRGWLMPAFTHLVDDPGWGNAISAVLFGAAHGFSDYPMLQFFGGLWLGHVSQKNNWRLAPSIFLHFWWDFLLFIGDVLFDKNSAKQFAFEIPIVTWSF